MTETAHHHQTVQTPEEVSHDLLDRLPITGGGVVAVILLAILALAGAVRVILMALSGPHPGTDWGYAVAILAFLMSAAQGAPVLSFASRLAKGYWGIPLRRAADLLAVSGLVTTPLFFILAAQLPDWHGRIGIWNDWPGAPQVPDVVGSMLISFAGLAILYVTSIPDMAAARDLRGSRIAGALSLGWRGTKRQWDVLSTGVILLGAFYLMWFSYIHMYLIADFAMSLVPEWHSSIMPPYHVVSSLQAGAGLTLVTLWILRKVTHLEAYINHEPFWGASKLLLATSLLFFYFTYAEFDPTWYGRQPWEIDYLGSLMFGPFFGLFVISFALNFVIPFALLIWNPIRSSVNGPAFVGALIVIGNLVDRVRIYLASWTIYSPVGGHIETWPLVRIPNLGDAAIVVGAVAAVFLLYLLVLRLVTPISIWEYKQLMLLKTERAYMKLEVAVIAKPR